MRNCLISTNKYQNKLRSTITLDRLRKSCTGTKDVQKFAFSQMKRSNNVENFKDNVNSNLEIKQRKASKEEAVEKI